jgi:hypothetical protein
MGEHYLLVSALALLCPGLLAAWGSGCWPTPWPVCFWGALRRSISMIMR